MEENRKKVEMILEANKMFDSAYKEHECDTYREKIDITSEQLKGSVGEVLLKTVAVGIIGLVAISIKSSILNSTSTLSEFLTSFVNFLPYSAVTLTTFGLRCGESIGKMLDIKKEHRLANMDYAYSVHKVNRDVNQYIEENFGGKSR